MDKQALMLDHPSWWPQHLAGVRPADTALVEPVSYTSHGEKRTVVAVSRPASTAVDSSQAARRDQTELLSRRDAIVAHG